MVQEILCNIISKYKNRYEVLQVVPMYNAHPYFFPSKI